MLGYSHTARPCSAISQPNHPPIIDRKIPRPMPLQVGTLALEAPLSPMLGSNMAMPTREKENKDSSFVATTPDQTRRSRRPQTTLRDQKLNELYQQLVTDRKQDALKPPIQASYQRPDLKKQLRQTMNTYSTLSQNLLQGIHQEDTKNDSTPQVNTPQRTKKRVLTVANFEAKKNEKKPQNMNNSTRTPTLTPNKSQISLYPPPANKTKRDRSASHNQLFPPMTRSPSVRSPTLKSRRSSRTEQGITGVCLGDFHLGECKGEGRFGKVYLAVHKKTGFMCALKQIKKQQVRLMMDQFIRQIKISLFLCHPNLVKMYGCFSDQDHFYIMMEYMEQGSLFKYVRAKKQLEEEDACNKLAEVCQAVSYLHRNDILHRDIKPQNIVLSNGVCKLCDFGWAVCSTDRRNTYCGTLDYVCPEILEGDSYDNFVDVWAIGVLAYEMLTGKAPFYHLSRKQTMKSIMNCQFTYPPQVGQKAQLFIAEAIRKDPDSRSNIELLLKHPFIKEAITQTN